jgi:hypothetical protein
MAAQAASTARDLTNLDIVEMLSAGLSAEVVVAKIRASTCAFDTSPAALKNLKAAQVPDSIVLAMVEASGPKGNVSTADIPAQRLTKTGYLYVYRQRRYTGSALAPSIYVDDEQIARIGNGRRCVIRLDPGIRNVRSDDKSSAISLEVKPGEKYFVRIDEAIGFWKGHGKLTMLMPEQGSAEFKLQKPLEEDRKIAKAMLEEDRGGAGADEDEPK